MEQQSSNAASQISLKEYKVRPGTIDSGKDYEFKIAALLSLYCLLEDVNDMWLASNADGTGAFDDVILNIKKTKNGKAVTFMMQLKHQDNPKIITEKDFLLGKGDFSLGKYFKDINKLHEALQSKSNKEEIVNEIGKSSIIFFILFTNRNLDECKYLEKYCDKDLDFLNTGINKNSYKFINTILPDGTRLNVTNKYNDMYLLSDQVHIKHLNDKLTAAVQKLLKTDKTEYITQNYVKFITEWAKGSLGGHYCITKNDIQFKLVELAFHHYEINIYKELVTSYDNNQKLAWNKMVLNKNITIVDSNKTARAFLLQYVGNEVMKYCNQIPKTWGEKFSEKQQKAFYRNNKHFKIYLEQRICTQGKISLIDVYKCVWRMNGLSLLLEIQTEQDYKNILHVLRLSNCSFKVILMYKGIELPARKKEDMKRFETMQDLDDDMKKVLLQQAVKLQGRAGIILEKIIDESMHRYVTCLDILNVLSNNFNIANELTPLPEYFIERSIIKTVIKPEVFQLKTNEIILMLNASEACHEFNYEIAQFENVDFNNPKAISGIISVHGEISSEDLNKLKSAEKPIHVLSSFSAEYFEWRWSYKSTKTIEPFQIDLELKMGIETFTQLLSGTTLVSSGPGMGKSYLMDYFTHNAPLEKWILKIDLNRHQSYFRHRNCKTSTTKALNHLIYFYDAIYNENKNNKLNRAIFEKLADTKNIIVLLDGFDEVAISYKEEATNMAKSFDTAGYALWITTRPHMKSHLGDEFKISAITLKPFSINDQKNFLTKYFSVTNSDIYNISQTILEEFVDKLLKASKRNLNDRDLEFTGVPLQSKLLADVFNKECRRCLNNNEIVGFNENFDLIYLYRNFIDNKIEILLDKFGGSGNDLHAIIKQDQSLFALKLIFALDNYVDTELMQKLYKFYKSEPNRVQLLQRQGILTADEQFNISYIHRTFAEFLSAEWLSANLKNEDSNIREFAHSLIKERFTNNYKFLFSIFDRILINDLPCSLHVAIMNNREDEAINILNLNPDSVSEVDDGERSPLHMISLYGFRYPLPHNSDDDRVNSYSDIMLLIIERIPEDKILSTKPDAVGYTPLDYALANGSLHIANKFRAISIKYNVSAFINLKFQESYLNYCLNSYKKLFEILLPYFISRNLLQKNIKKTTTLYSCIENFYDNIYFEEYKRKYRGINALQLMKSEDGQVYSGHNNGNYTNMRYAIAFGSKNNILELAASDAEINKQDIDKWTPLHYAILHQRSDIVNLFLNKDANINKQNSNNNTPLHLAIINFNKKIIKLLLLAGAAVDIRNINGDTVLHLIPQFYQNGIFKSWFETPIYLNILKRFISSKADINLQNNDGNTPLHTAASSGFNDLISELLNNGAEINSRNVTGDLPLHLASKKGSANTVELLLQAEADVNLKNDKDNTPLHLTVTNNVNTVKLLLAKNADVNVKNKEQNTPLHLAIKNGYREIADLLITKDADLNIGDEYQQTPLHAASKLGHLNIASLLIAKGAHVNAGDGHEETPLHLASREGCKEIAEMLIAKQADINAANVFGDTALHMATRNGFKEVVNLLIVKGADINVKNERNEIPLHLTLANQDIRNLLIASGSDVDARGIRGWTSLHQDILHNRSNSVHLLVSKMKDINVKDDDGNTPLHLACRVKEIDILGDLLLNKKADINMQNEKGDTPLHVLVLRYSVENLVEVFIKQGACVNITNENGDLPLHLAIQKSSEKVVHALILDEIDLNVKNKDGNTPLHLAIKHHKKTCAESFIAKGADINLKNNNGDTSLHFALEYEEKIANLLISQEADFNISNNDGNLPFHLASQKGYRQIVTILANKVQDINVRNKSGNTALHLASEKRYGDIVKLLLTSGANINALNENDDTPLNLALKSYEPEVPALLINFGTDINLKNKNHDMPLHLASQNYHTTIVELLITKGAAINALNKNNDTVLHLACIIGNLVSVQCLLDNGANWNLKNNDGNKPLHVASQHFNQMSRDKIIKLLINKGANIHEDNNNGDTPLHLALLSDNSPFYTLLCNKDTDLHKTNKDGKTPYKLALKHGCTYLNKLLTITSE